MCGGGQKNQLRTEDGQSAVEVALVLPLLLTLLLGVISFGTMIATYMDLTSATRDGARRAVSARAEQDPEGAVRATFEGSSDLVNDDDVELTVTGGWDQDDTVTVRAVVPHELDVMGVVVWQGNLRAESVVRIG